MAPKPNSVDLAWAAGLIDGEGCIHIKRTGTTTLPGYTLYLQLTMCHKATVEKFATLFRGTVRMGGYTSMGRCIYVCALGGQKARKALEALLPNLVTKHEEALVALEFAPKTNQQGKKRYTRKEIERCRTARKALQNLKKAK